MLVAALALVLFVIAALVVDLGMARDRKAQSQNAADAAALAAANQLYLDLTKPMSQRMSEAAQVARDYAASNFGVGAADWSTCTDPARLATPSATQCISFDNPTAPTLVRVRIPDVPVRAGFGAVAGVSEIQVRAAAEAGVEAETITAEGGLRPWAICSKVVTTSATVVFAPMKNGSVSTKDAAGGCGPDGPPGGWWVAQCTGQSNGNGATDAIVLSGCPTSGYRPVANQPSGTPAQLSTFLRNACPNKTHNDTCLASDPGNNFHNSTDEWQTLVGHTITMPVFCFKPTCDPNAYAGTGQNASYAIHKIATVEICGFKFTPRAASTGWPTEGPCATNNPKGFTSNDVDNGGGIFLVIKKLTGGPTGDWQMTLPPSKARLTQ